MLTICGVSNPHNGLSDELLHVLSFMLCFVPKQNKLWKLGVPESCADLHIYWNFQPKKLYFWQENTSMQSILYYTCFGGNPLKMPAKWQVYIKEETKLFLESMYLWGAPNILRKTLCMIFCLEMFTYMFNWIAAIMQSLWNLWWHGKLKKSPTPS